MEITNVTFLYENFSKVIIKESKDSCSVLKAYLTWNPRAWV